MTGDEFPHFEIEFDPKGKSSGIRPVNCGEDYETKRSLAKTEIERRKQLAGASGLTNQKRRRLAKEINALERTFNLGRYSPVAEIDDKRKERRLKAEEKKLQRLAKNKDQADSQEIQ
jgi:hypothetical protein